MKTAVHFGAGKIGKGFIADLLHQSGYHIVFVDVVEAAIAQINQEKQYSLFLIDHDYEERVIDHISALSSITQQPEAIEAIGRAEVITTSVMASNLPKIAPLLARGLKERLERGGEKVTVMACENAIMGTDILKQAMIDTGIITEEELDQIGVYPNTAVDRMVFDGVHHGKAGIEVGDAFELPIERKKLIDPDSEPIRGGEYVDQLEKYLQRKIYMVNCAHAVSGYLGYVHGYRIVQDALRDEKLLPQVKAAAMESASALEKIYGFDHDDLVHYMDTMIIKRFMTPGVSDPIVRVCREPIRKLSANDRILGPAIQCEKYGLDNSHLLKGAACALRFDYMEDPQAAELQREIHENGVDQAITKYTGLQPEDRMFRKILEEYQKLA